MTVPFGNVIEHERDWSGFKVALTGELIVFPLVRSWHVGVLKEVNVQVDEKYIG